jgi:hypothetical protein
MKYRAGCLVVAALAVICLQDHVLAQTDCEFTVSEQFFESRPGSSVFACLFGQAIDIDGDVAVIGAPGGTIAFVYRQTGTSWTLEATLSNPGTSFNEFGASVAIEGDLVAVGGPLNEPSSGLDSGSVFVYRYDGTTPWQLVATFNGESSSHRFGHAVDISWGSIAVGAPLADSDAASNSGAAYVYDPHATTPNTWLSPVKVQASTLGSSDEFGAALSIDGDRLAVGAPRDDFGTATNSGATYVFVRDTGLSTWSLDGSVLRLASQTNDDLFGASVSLNGTTLASASGDVNTTQGTNSGAIQIFERDSSWSAVQLIEGQSANEQLGTRVRLGTGMLAASAFVTSTNSGEVRIYRLQQSEYVKNESLVLTEESVSTNPETNFGDAIALSGSMVLVGACRCAVVFAQRCN